MPQTVLKLYSKFPLVVLPGEKSPVVQSDFKDPVLWVSLRPLILLAESSFSIRWVWMDTGQTDVRRRFVRMGI